MGLALSASCVSPASGDLTIEETSRLQELEDIIAEGLAGFLKVGLAFAEVRFKRLYRATHDTFESWCKSRWGLSLSRTTQIISSVKVFDNIVTVFPQDAQLLCENLNEHALRPLTRIEPELQTATWELIRALKKEPDASIIQEVVDSIKEAIQSGWQERQRQLEGGEIPESNSAPPLSPGRNGNSSSRPQTLQRQSDQLGALCRWACRINSWDPAAIAAADDELCLKRRLKAARQLKTFCETLIEAIEGRLSWARPRT
jgi:hypothetical protein